MFYDRVKCFESVSLKKISLSARRIEGTVEVRYGEFTDSFRLIFTYDQDISPSENLAGLILSMPLINFAYFTETIELGFPVTELDSDMLTDFVRINNREVFVNKICRRRYEFFRSEYLPAEEDITEKNAAGGTRIIVSGKINESYVQVPESKKVAVLSSGGKESLLSYGILKEAGATVYPFFVNESGRHWFPAKPAHDEFRKSDSRTMKVWTNVDRFYRFMLDRMKILDRKVVSSKTDTYPVQLFIFPVYIFSLLPLAIRHRIGNIVLGDEFDDPREMPKFHGMKHYFGVYDQSEDFNDYMKRYFIMKGYRISVWSALYSISGSVVERILVERYPDLFSLQRSCHSCRSEEGSIVPCGTCTKCLGVLLFILAARGNPETVGYRKEHFLDIESNPELSRIRLDPDEFSTALARSRKGKGEIKEHVDGIHILPWEDGSLSRVPSEFRGRIGKLLEKYTYGKFKTDGKKWIRV